MPDAVAPARNGGRTTRPLLDEVGSVGLPQYSGRVFDEPLAELQGRRGVAVYRQMGFDPVLGGTLFAIDQLIRRVEWSAEPASDDPGDRFIADFTMECLNDMNKPFSEVVSSINSKLQYGWSYHSLVYKLRQGADGKVRSAHDDGLVGWRKMAPRLQETLDHWDLDDAGGVNGMYQQAAPTFEQVHLPIERSALFRTSTARENPEGLSIFRSAYSSWQRKRRYEIIEGIATERNLAGLPVARVPASYMAANAPPEKAQVATDMLDIASRVRRDEEGALLLPSDRDESGNYHVTLELLSAATGEVSTTLDPIIARLDQRMAMSCMADFILLGHEQVGSFALGESKTELFTLALNTFIQQDADVFNTHVIPRLVRYNGWPAERAPKLRTGTVERVDLKDLSAYVTALAGAGMPLFPDEELEGYLARQGNLPQANKDETA